MTEYFFDFDAVNEIGDKVNLSVCVEIMAQHSNIILIGNDRKIIDAVKRVDENKSSVREILPSVTYVLPPQQKNAIFSRTKSKIFVLRYC